MLLQHCPEATGSSCAAQPHAQRRNLWRPTSLVAGSPDTDVAFQARGCHGPFLSVPTTSLALYLKGLLLLIKCGHHWSPQPSTPFCHSGGCNHTFSSEDEPQGGSPLPRLSFIRATFKPRVVFFTLLYLLPNTHRIIPYTKLSLSCLLVGPTLTCRVRMKGKPKCPPGSWPAYQSWQIPTGIGRLHGRMPLEQS